jgi:sodium/proline symporter
MFNWNPTAITFIGYLVLMSALGFIAWYYTRNFNDYVLGGRRLGAVVTALSVGASDMSGWLLMGVPGAVYVSGISESWMPIGLTIGTYLNWKIVAARLRVYTEVEHNALTLPDFFTHRFGDTSKLLRIIAATVILIFFTIYCASGMVAGARLFENTFNLDYGTAVWIGAAATILYVYIGGFLAVSWTDAIQASLMCAALVIVPCVVMSDVGGYTASMDAVRSIDPKLLNILTGQSFIGVVSLMAWGLGYFGQPHILVRFMATKSIKALPNACRISIMWMIFCLTGAVMVGLFGLVYFTQHPDQGAAVVQNHERVFIVLSQILFNPWVAGILLSAILAAVMSTLSCQLLVCSSTLTQDFYRSIVRPRAKQRELLWFGRSMVLLVAVVAIIIAQDPNSLVLSLVSYAWAGFGAAFGPVIIMSLWWKRMTRNGALAGMVVGAATVLIWHQFAWFGLYEIVPGFLFGLVAIVVFSLIGEKPSEQMEKNFDFVVRTVRGA